LKKTNEININENVLCDTAYLGIIKITGEDATIFLQGQFSNDIDLLNQNNSQLNSYNSPKGRMYTSFRLFKNGEDYFMLIPKEIIEPIIKRLRMFVMRSKVTLEDLSDAWKCIGLSGESLNQAIPQFPDDIDAAKHDGHLSYLRIAGVAERLIIVGPNDEIKSLQTSLAPTFGSSDSDHWKRLDIHAGLPNVYTYTQESFVAQMVNLPLVNGVSFTKGCYPGQEVVARMHYLGKLKKRMFRIIINSKTPPKPGESLYLSGSENTQSVGQIVDAQANDNNSVDALAVIQTSATEKGNIRLASVDGPAVDLADLPYSFE